MDLGEVEPFFRLFTGYDQPELLASSAVMKEFFKSVEAIAPDLWNVLLEGETGTGKRRVARALHALSRRREGPFVVVNFGELTENLIESELFGHARGAFTGAVADKIGLVEVADTGTLFLDEIDKSIPSTQKKLLRLVEEREFRRVGELTNRNVDIVIIAACNRDLWGEVKLGRFLNDLYFRIKVEYLRIPPLRERREDIRPLLNFFMKELARKTGGAVPVLDSKVWELLLAHPWPGNVRELENSVRKIFSLAREGEVEEAKLRAYLNPGAPALNVGLPMGEEDPRRRETAEVLRRFGWKKAPAARALGISRPTLYDRMRRWGLTEDR